MITFAQIYTNMDGLVFDYSISDILEEVTKRTSYLGKMRGTEDEPYLLDRLSLTSGENFLFNDFLSNAVSETYQYLKAFGRNVTNAVECISTYTDIALYKNYGLKVSINNVEQPVEEKFQVSGVTATKSGDNIVVSLANPVSFYAKTGVIYKYSIVYNIRTVLGGTVPCAEERTFDSSNITLATGSTNTYTGTTITDFVWTESGGTHTLSGVDVYITITPLQPATIQSIAKDTYIEYRTDFTSDDVYEVYKAYTTCNSKNWKEYVNAVSVDPRGKVVFSLEKTDYFDDNMVYAIDRDIKEAIVNHIIFRWFEYTNKEEAKEFYDKFDNHAHAAQIGLNSEKYILQRKHSIF